MDENPNKPYAQGYIIDPNNLPDLYPTHLHSAEFWEALGRTVATFGFLEEVLGKAIFAFTATRDIPEEKIDEEFARWLPTLRKALSDPLGGLIRAYESSVRAHQQHSIEEFDDLVDDLKKAAEIRNVFCHGSWRKPDTQGRSNPFFVDRKDRIFKTPIDIAYLKQVQQHVTELTCAVVNTVTHMGWQFPGSAGPGNPIFEK
ncbi:hypothetical protein [Mesorhizobium sp. LNHC229A00]|uniref:hypothetical protein n=1 Tax=Mesorhizobium sp. LNHC229A00 TaxID=1287240 RepID=UPI0003CF94DC|nr:hypothetical protein [Mesorhizobium sp. LNHC229A00]ESY94941.1 hypothetical protein X741_08220 [Mesorhizobium sp. LNHC229A00]